LISGSGADTLTGGSGADTFRFEAISMSRAANGIDTIMDFSFAAGDRIDVSLIDANTSLANDQAFTSLIAEGATFNAAGQIRLTTIAGGYQIDLNTNTNSAAEMSIIVMTTDAAAGALGWLVP
jgi:Ca2+-binding RTX toxin-like protein